MQSATSGETYSISTYALTTSINTTAVCVLHIIIMGHMIHPAIALRFIITERNERITTGTAEYPRMLVISNSSMGLF